MVKLEGRRGYIDILGQDPSWPKWKQNARYSQVHGGVRCFFGPDKRLLGPPEVLGKSDPEPAPQPKPVVIEDSEPALSAAEKAQEDDDTAFLGPGATQMTQGEIVRKAYDAENEHELRMLADDANIALDGRLRNLESIREAIVKAAQDVDA